MIRSPAHFERLLGSPAAQEGRSRAQEGPRATAARGGRFLPYTRSAKSPGCIPAAQYAGPGQGRTRKLWVQGHITGDGGDRGNQQEGSGAGGLSGHGVPTGRAPGPFRAAEERCLRHFIFTLVSVDTCSSEAFLN